MTKVAKPGALVAGGAVRVVSPASAPDRNAFGRGVEELERLQYRVRLASPEMHADGYFAGPLAKRAAELQAALLDDENQAVMAPRGRVRHGAGVGPAEFSARAAPEAGRWLQRFDHAACVSVAAMALGHSVWADGGGGIRQRARIGREVTTALRG